MAFLFMRGKGHEVLPYDETGGKVFQSDIAVHSFVNAFSPCFMLLIIRGFILVVLMFSNVW